LSRVYEALKKADAERKGSVRFTKEEGTEVHLIEDLKLSDILVTLKDPKSQAAEQFKKVCIHILQNSPAEKKTILITSALPLEGKSVSSANLAIVFAQTPEIHAILIDADLRKPNLHKLLGVSIDKGLRDYLEGSVPFSEIFYKTSIPKLSLIPAGRPLKSSVELLSSFRMKSLINELRERYPKSYIIIDSTPILLTSESDILLNQADGIIVVVEYGKTQRDALERSLKFLDKKKIVGIIFNKVDYKLLRYNYGYSHYYNEK